MNNNDRVIWNGSLRGFQVCSELVKAGKGSSSVNSVDKPMPRAFPSEKSAVFMAISVSFSTLFLSVLLALPGTASASIVVDNGQE
ncbi:ESPR-type extended signal peptide-containing protein, partial [Haloferax sp. Atlit-16N]|uniref:ESPR-type extended signal peptide-containing protein n=1 Tax=Haloferax sp. Atlit-16N TaxID=2077202 RepID=UPI003742B1AE